MERALKNLTAIGAVAGLLLAVALKDLKTGPWTQLGLAIGLSCLLAFLFLWLRHPPAS